MIEKPRRRRRRKRPFQAAFRPVPRSSLRFRVDGLHSQEERVLQCVCVCVCACVHVCVSLSHCVCVCVCVRMFTWSRREGASVGVRVCLSTKTTTVPGVRNSGSGERETWGEGLRNAWLDSKAEKRLPGKGNSKSHGARPVCLIITMMKWIRTSRLSIEFSLYVVRVRGERDLATASTHPSI